MSPYASPNPKLYDLEEAFPQQQNSKKSVLTKVKERAKKLRHSLSGSRKKHEHQGHGDNSTPAWGVTLEDVDDDDEDEDPEYLGAPSKYQMVLKDNVLASQIMQAFICVSVG